MNKLTHRLGYNVANCEKCEYGEEVEREISAKITFPMCLHGYKYKIDGMTFEASLPKWATDKENFQKLILERNIRHTLYPYTPSPEKVKKYIPI